MIVVLETAGLADVDRELWSLGRVVFIRGAGRTVAETDAPAAAVRRAFARSGVGVEESTMVDRPSPPLRPAIATTLEPLGDVAARYDVLTLRPVEAGEASRKLLASSWPLRRRRSRDLERCRQVLHDEDRALAWRRVLWAEPRVLRQLLPHARPVVFDHDAIERCAERWTFARDHAVGRWLRS